MRAAIIPVTPLQQNCSLIWCTRTMRGALVDPGGDLDRLKEGVARAGVTLEKLLDQFFDYEPEATRRFRKAITQNFSGCASAS